MEKTMQYSKTSHDPFKISHELGFHTLNAYEDYMKYYCPKLGDIVVDAGAHVGIYTQKFAKLVGDKGFVLSFEPDYRALGFLTLNTEHLKNVYIFPYCLWDREGYIQFHAYKPTLGMSGVLFEFDKEETYPVRTRKLDDIIKELSIKKINFLKMDIEGSEVRALKGLEESIDIIDHMAIASYHAINVELTQKTLPYVKQFFSEHREFKARTEMGKDGEIVYVDRL